MENISFTDYDLDFGDLGGLVRWDKPLDESKAQVHKNTSPQDGGKMNQRFFVGRILN